LLDTHYRPSGHSTNFDPVLGIGQSVEPHYVPFKIRTMIRKILYSVFAFLLGAFTAHVFASELPVLSVSSKVIPSVVKNPRGVVEPLMFQTTKGVIWKYVLSDGTTCYLLDTSLSCGKY